MAQTGSTWQQIHIILPGASIPAASELLENLGALSVATSQAGGDDHFDLAAPRYKTWEKTELTALYPDDIDLAAVIDALKSVFPDHARQLSVEIVADQDWERAWLERFQPIRVGENLWICPSWCEPPRPDARNIILDPGLAFGTGTHPTTAMCLETLATLDLEHKVVVDFGCGSGILAIGAALCGAHRVLANDIDPLALQASLDNARINHVENRLDIGPAADTADTLTRLGTKADLVVANILADALIELHDDIIALLKPAGKLILSGILEHQADTVRSAYSDHDLTVVTRDNWCLLKSC